MTGELLADLFGDPEIEGLIGDAARLRAMLAVEAALAEIEGRLGVISAEAGAAIARAARALDVDAAALASSTARDGVAVPALVDRLKAAVGVSNGSQVHFGPTSQDIVDTAFVLTSLHALDVLAVRLERIVGTLATLAEQHIGTVMVGRTRYQSASPTTFGLKAAGWALPLARQRTRLRELRPRLAVVSLGGAVGNLAALGDKGPAVEAALAAALGLGVPAGTWHAARDTIAELAGWLSLTTACLAKVGTDILLLAQTEVAEARPAAAGRSSTMPQKSNPIVAETLVTLGRVNADRLSSIHHAVIHAHERDGSAWSIEWLVLPAMLTAAGAATRTAQTLLDGLLVDVDGMRERAMGGTGAPLAEAATFALAGHMPRDEAARHVAAALVHAAESGRSLTSILAEEFGPRVDWVALAGLGPMIAVSAERTRRILDELARAT